MEDNDGSPSRAGLPRRGVLQLLASTILAGPLVPNMGFGAAAPMVDLHFDVGATGDGGQVPLPASG